MRAPFLATLVAFVSFSLPAGAATVGIDFESLADLEVVTTQFAGQGITFGNARVLVAGASLNEIDFPPSSGTHVITGIGAGPITIVFAQPAESVSIDFVSADMGKMSYFDSANVLLGQTAIGPNLGSPNFAGFTTFPGKIAKVTVANADGNADVLVLDNVIVRLDVQEVPAVPEPSAFLAMACGLVTVAASLRRRA